MVKEWVTVQECMGIPGFPNTAPAVRKRLEDLSLGMEGSKRKRPGTKAFEYSTKILPDYARAVFAEGKIADAGELKEDEHAADLLEFWIMIFKLLTPQQQKDCIELFKNRGIRALLPAILYADDGKEIFEQCDTDEQVQAAPKLSTQGKAG
ncbi:Mu family DNA-binding protein [Trabulsiella guamensis ATCC 49490]|uniref:Mu family DNA-binding protein n=1 Tax=Trabulsiella guamensis ATCC 49490 TaxID=1005994 RepID=A0A084ZKV1_9ENTR|nr:DNA-binding protein [Trabulsiella guamensis]KFB98095.1 Mu family DNA-binding protein [Trabulsiella guamensis ATCC 49490]